MGSDDLAGDLPFCGFEPGEPHPPRTPLPSVSWLPVLGRDPVDENTSMWFVGWGPVIPRSRWGRFKLRLRVRRDRLRDALSVWRGEAEAVPWEDSVRDQFERECG